MEEILRERDCLAMKGIHFPPDSGYEDRSVRDNTTGQHKVSDAFKLLQTHPRVKSLLKAFIRLTKKNKLPTNKQWKIRGFSAEPWIMSSSTTLRRRLHHGDVDGKRREHYETSGFDALSEPLLGNDRDYDDKFVEKYALQGDWDDERKKVQLHWTILFSQLIAQWAHWLANIAIVSGSLLGRLFAAPFTAQDGHKRLIAPSLSPLQEERIKKLQVRLQVPFDGTRMEHQDALKQLWRLAYPNREIPPLKSELWKEMGWQGTDPSTDFRGGGFISLENLIYFADKHPESFQSMLYKRDGKRAEWEYPFAVAGINISFMLVQMLDLQSGRPTSLAAVRFLELLAEDEMAFDNLYCVAFQMMDAQWLAKRASYMEFNDVLKSTRTQIERELELEDISSVRDLPAYNLLRR
ncbi:hypothetical protein Nepgr_011502 [Nepenthes gracilis]|uniref:ELMO domain-containing protein n=1 Tax=Nepenthes gracilis TaxID=150966 RepID=A0AAD3XMG1_NEPGR|nr:hypothetical protein Nepgr_011502 [Nepenthes gracilis]